MSTGKHARHEAHGFSMVELLVTVLLAGIIFAVMVPMFAGALKKSAADNNRVTATNIAQERLEKVRLLGQLHYGDITGSNLNSATYPSAAAAWFKSPYTPTGGRTYTITSVVVPDNDANAPSKRVTVAVTWPETTSAGVTSSHATTMQTVVKNPAATTETTQTSEGGLPVGGPGPWTLTITFKDWQDVDGSSQGVSLIRKVPTPQATVIARERTTSAKHAIVWTNVPGGLDITYVVRCVGDHGTFETDIFHLLSTGTIYFDTNPGNQ